MLRFENSKNPYEMRQVRISDFMDKYETAFVGTSSKAVAESLADSIMLTGIKHADAIHISCAIISECDYFITTDKRLLKYQTEKIKIVTPIDFIQLMEDELID